MFSTATQPPPHRRRRPPHHFVVSAITFEGFKLRSSNLTHALFIQISRTSSITDIVVQSKMAAGGHFVQQFQKKKKLRIQNGRRWPFCPKFKKNTFSHLPHFSQIFPTFSNFSPLFTTFPHFFQLFPTFSNFSPLLSTFSNFFQLFTTFHYFFQLFPTFSHFSPCFPYFSPLFPLFPISPHFFQLFFNISHF